MHYEIENTRSFLSLQCIHVPANRYDETSRKASFFVVIFNGSFTGTYIYNCVTTLLRVSPHV